MTEVIGLVKSATTNLLGAGTEAGTDGLPGFIDKIKEVVEGLTSNVLGLVFALAVVTFIVLCICMAIASDQRKGQFAKAIVILIVCVVAAAAGSSIINWAQSL
jgi:hypothetical protein